MSGHQLSFRLMITGWLQRDSCFKHVVLLVAVSSGMFFAFLWHEYEMAVVDEPYFLTSGRTVSDAASKSLPVLSHTSYTSWLSEQGLRSRVIPEEVVSFGDTSKLKMEHEFLGKEIPVLCLVLSKGRGKAKAVKETWGRRCNHIIFYASYADGTIPVHRFSSLEPSHVSFCKILVRISDSLDLKQFKWLLISDDSAFVVIENIRKLVAPLDPNELYYLGRAVKRFGLPPYNALDSGILLSQGSFVFLTTRYFTNFSSCERHHIQMPQTVNQTKTSIAITRNFETSIAQLLLTNNNTSPCDTRDTRKRSKFMPFSPEKYLIKGAISIFSIFWRQNIFHSPIGRMCCSPEAIAFNGMSPTKMYLTYYLLYHTSVFRNSPLGLANKRSNRGT